MGGNQAEAAKPGRQLFNVDQPVSRGTRSMKKETLKSGRKGQELVEFAIMLPLLLLVLIGVIDIGRVFHASITIANASRMGARYAISYGYKNAAVGVDIDVDKTINRAETEAQNSGITLNSVTVCCPGGCPASGCVHGGPLTVTTNHNFQFLFNAFIGSGINLSHSTEMKIPW